MGKETKIGLVVVTVLAVFLGAFVVQRIRRPGVGQSVVAQNAGPQGESGKPATDPQESPPVVVETGGFASDHVGSDPTDDMSYAPDEALLDVPIGPGTAGTTEFNDRSNAESLDVPNNGYSDNETVEEPSRWESHRNRTERASLDEAPSNDRSTIELAGPMTEPAAPLAAPAEANDDSWHSSAADQTQTVRSSGQNRTTVVDDSRSTADYQKTTAGTPNLFEGATEELASPTTAPVVQAVEPRSSLPATSLEAQQWTVREGDTFWSISRQVYGSGRYFKALARWNEKTVPDPDRMRTGTVLETPPLARLEQADPELVAQRAASPTEPLPGLKGLTVPEQAGAFASPLGRKYYRVGRSDSLFVIAKKTLGQGGRWKELFELNQDLLEDPDRLAPGMILRLPSSATVEEFLSSRPAPGVLR